MQHPKQSQHRLKLSKLLAYQGYSNMLEKGHGVIACCPPPEQGRMNDLFELKEMFDNFYPEMCQDDSPAMLEYTTCAELLMQKINLL